jgi:hypothetical protein
LQKGPFPEKLTELTEAASVSSVSDQSSPICGEADSNGGRSPLQRDQRRALVQWIADNLRSSPLGRCAHCGSDPTPADPFVALFCDPRGIAAGVKLSVVPSALKESEARVALGIDSPDEQGRRAD